MANEIRMVTRHVGLAMWAPADVYDIACAARGEPMSAILNVGRSLFPRSSVQIIHASLFDDGHAVSDGSVHHCRSRRDMAQQCAMLLVPTTTWRVGFDALVVGPWDDVLGRFLSPPTLISLTSGAPPTCEVNAQGLRMPMACHAWCSCRMHMLVLGDRISVTGTCS
jgi:hypothetical protein